YPYYWVGPYRWGDLAYPGLPLELPQPSPAEQEVLTREREGGDPNLRSVRDVMGYYISATDGDLGHVEDFLVDDETWAIRHIIVDTRNRLPGRGGTRGGSTTNSAVRSTGNGSREERCSENGLHSALAARRAADPDPDPVP